MSPLSVQLAVHYKHRHTGQQLYLHPWMGDLWQCIGGHLHGVYAIFSDLEQMVLQDGFQRT